MRTRKLKSFVTGLLVYAMLITLVACSSNKANSTSGNSGNATSSAPAVASSESTADAAAEASRLAAEQAAREEEERKAAEEEAARQAAEEEARRQAEEEEARRVEEERNATVLNTEFVEQEIQKFADKLGYSQIVCKDSQVDFNRLIWVYAPENNNGYQGALISPIPCAYRNYYSCGIWFETEDAGTYAVSLYTLDEVHDFLEKYALFQEDKYAAWQNEIEAEAEENARITDDDVPDQIAECANQLGYTSVERLDQDTFWIQLPANNYDMSEVCIKRGTLMGRNCYTASIFYRGMREQGEHQENIVYVNHVFTPEGVRQYLTTYSDVFK